MNRNLRELHLAENKLTPFDALQLGILLSGNQSLQHIDLRYDFTLIMNFAVWAMATALRDVLIFIVPHEQEQWNRRQRDDLPLRGVNGQYRTRSVDCVEQWHHGWILPSSSQSSGKFCFASNAQFNIVIKINCIVFLKGVEWNSSYAKSGLQSTGKWRPVCSGRFRTGTKPLVASPRTAREQFDLLRHHLVGWINR